MKYEYDESTVVLTNRLQYLDEALTKSHSFFSGVFILSLTFWLLVSSLF